jgi:hypothetical protein
MHVSVRLYVCLVAAAASLGVIVDARSSLAGLTGWHVLLVLALVVLCAVGEHVSFQVHSGWSTHAATVPHVATALLLPPGLAGLVAGLGMLVYVFNRRLAPSKAILNTASDMLSVEAAACVAAQLGAPGVLVDPEGWRGLLTATIASGAYYIVSVSTIALVVALHQRRPLLEVFRGKMGVKAVTEIGLGRHARCSDQRGAVVRSSPRCARAARVLCETGPRPGGQSGARSSAYEQSRAGRGGHSEP